MDNYRIGDIVAYKVATYFKESSIEYENYEGEILGVTRTGTYKIKRYSLHKRMDYVPSQYVYGRINGLIEAQV